MQPISIPIQIVRVCVCIQFRYVGLLDSLTSTAESKDCPGVCVHTLATIICYEVLEDIQCPQSNQKCCVESNSANATSNADAPPPPPPSTTQRPTTTTTQRPTPKPTQKIEKNPSKSDATKNGKSAHTATAENSYVYRVIDLCT